MKFILIIKIIPTHKNDIIVGDTSTSPSDDTNCFEKLDGG